MQRNQDDLQIGTQARAAHQNLSGERWLIALVISATLITPCFWHRYLEAGDLGSHVYNAWLVQLIQQGKAPGLTIVPQWNNVLFDFMLTGLGHLFSLSVAARIAAAAAVLIFFWGAFSFICAATKWLPWALTPLLAMISYGWTFNAGLFNYYISVGLGFFALAIVYRGWSRYWLVLLVLVPLTYVAHPLGLCWALAAGAYVLIANHAPRSMHLLLFGVCLCGIVAVRSYLKTRAITRPASHSLFFYNGLDQVFFTNRYVILVGLLWCLILAAFALEFFRNGREGEFNALVVPLELYLLVEAGIQLLPNSILLNHSAAQFSELTDRLTSISAVLLCCLLAGVKPPRWLPACAGAITIIFFVFLYQDTGVIDRMEAQAEALVHAIPAGQRVIAAIDPPLRYRFQPQHILGLACLDRCFNYGNYEPSTGQFRVHASAGNGFVVSRARDSLAIDTGTYVAPDTAVPFFQIYQCGLPWTKLCVRSLAPGEPARAPVSLSK